MLFRKLVYFLFFISIHISLTAQEICDNCIDDDNDGLIDCYDEECRNNDQFCEKFYLGAIDESDSLRKCTESFFADNLWTIPGNLQSTPMAIGDIDGDGMPEVIADGNVYDGATGNLEIIGEEGDPAIGDIDGDGTAEIFINTPGGRLERYEHDFNTPTWFVDNPTSPSYPSIADFNGDGIAEVFFGATIFNAVSGILIVDRDDLIEHSDLMANPSTPRVFAIAADVLPDNYCDDCEGLELINGRNILSVNIDMGRVTKENTAPSIMGNGQMSCVDFDGDNALDVVVHSQDALYVYNPRSGALIGNPFFYDSGFNGNGGKPAVGNFDRDPGIEIAIDAGTDSFMVIDDDLSTILWSNTSLFDGTGPSECHAIFDFNCDGINEIIHQGGDGNLDIVNGMNGNRLAQSACFSTTRIEIAYVVDVNADGFADIVYACQDGIKAWSGATNGWAPARQVFNQFAYSPTLVNDDLTIPCFSQNKTDDKLPKELNRFIAQAPLYNSNGKTCTFDNSQLDVAAQIDTVIYLNCDSAAILFTFCNTSTDSTIANLYYSIYQIDSNRTRMLLGNNLIADIILPQQCFSTNITIPISGQEIEIFANDDGTDVENVPTPVLNECFLENNHVAVLIKKNVTVNDVKLGSDTAICFGDTIEIELDASTINGNNILWSTGDSTIAIEVSSVGQYSVAVFANPSCMKADTITVTDAGCSPVIFVPNAFSPNDDGINDLFTVKYASLDEISYDIYNRQGQKIFFTSEPIGSWDGTFNGVDVESGVYLVFVTASFNNENIYKKQNIFLYRQ